MEIKKEQPLNCTQRHINRLVKKYKEKGKAGFLHGNTGRQPANKINKEKRTKILDIYCKEIPNANFRHATELLDEHFNIQISDTTLNTILRGNYIVSPKANRITKRKMKKHLKDLRSKAHKKSEFVELETKLEELDRVDTHPRRPRSAYFGELIQMDASEHIWFDDIQCFLHVAIDDATGKIVGAYFDEQETLKGYYQVLCQILTLAVLSNRKTRLIQYTVLNFSTNIIYQQQVPHYIHTTQQEHQHWSLNL